MGLGSLISGEGGSYCRDLLEATKFFTLLTGVVTIGSLRYKLRRVVLIIRSGCVLLLSYSRVIISALSVAKSQSFFSRRMYSKKENEICVRRT